MVEARRGGISDTWCGVWWWCEDEKEDPPPSGDAACARKRGAVLLWELITSSILLDSTVAVNVEAGRFVVEPCSPDDVQGFIRVKP